MSQSNIIMFNDNKNKLFINRELSTKNFKANLLTIDKKYKYSR